MNSKQRRQYNRKFKYNVYVTFRANRFTDEIEQEYKVYDWCNKRFGKGNWEALQYSWSPMFRFTKERDLIMFKLRWL